MMDTIKEYLGQVRRLNEIINQKQLQVYELRELAKSQGSIDYSAVRVQSSSSATGKIDFVIKYIDLERAITREIERYIDKKNEILNQIHQLCDVEHMKVLHGKYIELKTFEEIAVEMKYCTRQVYRIHGHALQEFEKIYGGENVE